MVLSDILEIPSKTRYAGFFAGGGWLLQLSLDNDLCKFVSNSKEGSSKHFSVVPGTGLGILLASVAAFFGKSSFKSLFCPELVPSKGPSCFYDEFTNA